jgi:hypothetical protein
MAEENIRQSDTSNSSNPIEEPETQELDFTQDGDWSPEDPPSGSDPTIEDDLVAKEKALREMTQSPNIAPPTLEEKEDELENPENLLAQAADPEAQES